jgi:hypothetical protein
MKITIDTKEDSHEELRRVIKMLSAMIGEASEYNSSSQRSEPASGDGLFDMFGSPDASTAEQQQLGNGSEEGVGSSPAESETTETSDDGSDEDVKITTY